MVLLLAIAIFLKLAVAGADDFHPIILVPGYAGSKLEARLTDAYESANPVCQAHKDKGWFRLWLDDGFFEDVARTRCFAEQMTLHYNPEKDDYQNTRGVETRVPYFGSTKGFRSRKPNLKQNSVYMATLAKSLEQFGYKEGDNLFGAPYDFRHALAAVGHQSRVGSQFLQDLRILIEEASALNGGKPVIMLTHSMGGLFVLHLLNRSPLAWCQKFIKHFIALSAPWGGTVVDMAVFASGNAFGISTIEPFLLRRMVWTQQSNVWLLPSPKVFGLKPILFAQNGSQYTAFDIPQFFADLRFPEGIDPYEARTLPLVQQLPAPGVPVTCITGTGISTMDTLFYEDGFNERPMVAFGDGDGLVNLVSLLALEVEWSDMPRQNLKVTKLPNITHFSILEDDAALREIIQEISNINSLVLSSAA